MERINILKQHRIWEDWVGVSLGVLTALVPWIFSEANNFSITLNATILGLAILWVASCELVNLQRWEEYAMLGCGGWLVASPVVFDYLSTGRLGAVHVAFGMLVAGLGGLELWQDWKLSNQDMAKYGY